MTPGFAGGIAAFVPAVWLAETWPWLLTMFVLVVASALFSASEAALFSLHARSRRKLARAGVGGRIADRLLDDPERLLSAILFWNLLINMTFFAIASILAGDLESGTSGTQDDGESIAGNASSAIVFTSLSLLTVIFFSEMLPKSIAVLSPLRLSVLVAIPLNVAVRVVSPFLPLVKVSNVLAGRLIWPNFQPEPDIELTDIERAIELSTDDAALLQRERSALRALVEMAETRASELMRPRGKLILCSSPVSNAVLQGVEPAGGYLMVTGEEENQIIGSIGVRLLRPSQLDDLNSAIEPVIYVPWSARVSMVLEQLTEEQLSVAVVVDEYGEAIGALSIERIFRHILAQSGGGPEQMLGESYIDTIGEGHHQTMGSTSFRAVAKRLGVEVSDESIATVAGYIQRSNERLPRVGDTAILEPYEMVVMQETDGELTIELKKRTDTDTMGGER
ncbi:CNNM domain-containing protein [Stieleria varia]|uniref:Magnesium and cobalt efflux protein CorC n=1 Tax=Stieleria varia TaxID=2528005 RepID=A0A5C6AXN3_9BACT|nr:CNNM domain-containing protein [Stieleria varia]TWU04388.1 Magnesium and cobalt efflux protein CorC [Stieleria varia]